MRIDVTLWYRLITKGVITPNCYDGNSTISSSMPTSPSSPPGPISSSTSNDLMNSSSKENQSLSPPPPPPQHLQFSQFDEVILFNQSETIFFFFCSRILRIPAPWPRSNQQHIHPNLFQMK